MLNLVLIALSFTLISYYSEPLDYMALYIGGSLAAAYMISRMILAKLLNGGNFLLFDVVCN
ncbi:MAG TPA: hypothetical protein P5021_05940, partial [Candidatus Diapherotrites archaeon]|nr:hypothetical protein [Candidatus Diapherotrites archaeon]